jgi:hypothetical protein
MKCPMCENEKFENGVVSSIGPLKYRSSANMFKLGGALVTRARRCEECGFIAMFATEKKE